MDISVIIEKLKALQRKDVEIETPGCSCCSPYTVTETCKFGRFVEFEDIEKLIKELEGPEKIFTTNQGLGYMQNVTCAVVKIEGNDVYGKFVSGFNVEEKDIDFSVPFSLELLKQEGNNL